MLSKRQLVQIGEVLADVRRPKNDLLAAWSEILLHAEAPGEAVDALHEAGKLDGWPELLALREVRQDPEWHPEGDVWTHTLRVVDAFASRRIRDDREDLIVGLAALTHDLGKPATTVFDGRWKAPGHEEAGEKPTRSFLSRVTDDVALVNDVVALVVNHMRPKLLFKGWRDHGHNTDRAVRRLAAAVNVDRLMRVTWADSSGRPPKPQTDPAGEWLVAEVRRLAPEPAGPPALLTGRDLIALGVAPGPQLGAILDRVAALQKSGILKDRDSALRVAGEIVTGGR